MVEFLIALLVSIACAFVAHEAVRMGNMKWRELNMSPNFAALIALIFGGTGLLVLVIYGAIKIMVKRMLKY